MFFTDEERLLNAGLKLLETVQIAGGDSPRKKKTGEKKKKKKKRDARELEGRARRKLDEKEVATDCER